jgi:hypothetical protein
VAHTACFYADLELMRLLLDMNAYDTRCQDSGFSPLHYAALSGSLEAVELWLSVNHTAKLPIVSSETLTWWTKNGKGVTARGLVECVVQQNVDKQIESHGMALQEIHQNDKLFLATLERVAERLKLAESSKDFVPLTTAQVAKEVQAIERKVNSQTSVVSRSVNSDDASSTTKKKKKGKSIIDGENLASGIASQRSNIASNNLNDPSAFCPANVSSLPIVAESKPVPSPVKMEFSKAKDPIQHHLVVALSGMGFTQDQIMSGIRACGGFERALADDVVARIFGQDAGESEATEPRRYDSERARILSIAQKKKHGTKDEEAATKAEDGRLAAERLATKREEQRRRNREWNNRAQVRQIQETQAMIAKVAGSALPPIPIPEGVTAPDPYSATDFSTLKFTPAALPTLNDPDADASTIASSIAEIGNVEIRDRDDETVSTLGSWTVASRVQPAQPRMQQQTAPPGFGSNGFGLNEPPLLPKPPLLPPLFDASMSRGGYATGPSNGFPPSIPGHCHQSGLTLAGNHSVEMQQLHMDMQHSQMSTVHDTLPHNYTYNSSSLLSGMDGDPMHYGRSVQHIGILPPRNMGMGVLGRNLDGSSMYGMQSQSAAGQGRVMQQQNAMAPPYGLESRKQALDSSIIDSISTGTMPPGASLWADQSVTSGSSLLGNVIQSNNNSTGKHTNSLGNNPFATNNRASNSNNNDQHNLAGQWSSSIW